MGAVITAAGIVTLVLVLNLWRAAVEKEERPAQPISKARLRKLWIVDETEEIDK